MIANTIDVFTIAVTITPFAKGSQPAGRDVTANWIKIRWEISLNAQPYRHQLTLSFRLTG
jgi:hypothetical protein